MPYLSEVVVVVRVVHGVVLGTHDGLEVSPLKTRIRITIRERIVPEGRVRKVRQCEDTVVFTTHHSVVDVGGPHSGEEQQTHVGEVVHRQDEQPHHIRRCLETGRTIKR